jgi:hypothetical protein
MMNFELPEIKQLTLGLNTVNQVTAFKDRYFSLLNNAETESQKVSAIGFLEKQLLQASIVETKFPMDEEGLLRWLAENSEQAGKQFQEYLRGRRNGKPRRFFSNKSHALFFIKNVAPTKMVDGAWLSGFINYHKNEKCFGLIKTYLEELGEGIQEKNHVSLYRKLLRSYGLNLSHELEDKYYQQGAIQLALGQLTEYFMPEAIGFNLGYEQLPLHLLITAYELKELGIDSYYFTLHVTIDNANSGHAKLAVQSVLDNIPQLGDREGYFSRVFRGFQLNNLGAGTEAIIADFNLEQEFMSIMKHKANTGKYMHGNHCLIEGRSINDWLSDPERISAFIKAFESSGWILRHQDPTESRFWKLIDNNKAQMFGVFTPYEKQVIYDWIAGAFLEQDTQHVKTLKSVLQNNAHDFCPHDFQSAEIKKIQNTTNIIP